MRTKLLIFGITGDLSRRKLLPALKQLYATGRYDDMEIIGVSRREVDVPALLHEAVGDTSFADKVSVFSMDLADAHDYVRLKEYIALTETEQLICYLSVPPAAVSQIVALMGEAGLNTPNVKLLFEKPFGMDTASAVEALARTEQHYSEQQIYRIDHYLAKEMAQNIVAIRGRNALFSRLWSAEHIEKIEILASETIGIEGRVQFYEQTGALRDVVQGHLLQLLALVLMDIPDDFDWQQLPARRLDALKYLIPADPARAVRAQYAGYQTEVENLGSQIETFVSVELFSRDPDWAGVPIRLTTGKALREKTTEIHMYLRKNHEAESNRITFRIQPNEGVEIDLYVKKPGYGRDFATETLGFTYADDKQLPDAYERVLVDAISSHKNLFTEGGEVLRSWQLLQPLLDAWAFADAPIRLYEKNSTPIEVLEG